MKPGIVINLQMFDDGSPPSLTGMRNNADGTREVMDIFECGALMNRSVDLLLCSLSQKSRAEEGPKIQLAHGPVGQG